MSLPVNNTALDLVVRRMAVREGFMRRPALREPRQYAGLRELVSRLLLL